jgi:hypothetical protein
MARGSRSQRRRSCWGIRWAKHTPSHTSAALSSHLGGQTAHCGSPFSPNWAATALREAAQAFSRRVYKARVERAASPHLQALKGDPRHARPLTSAVFFLL